MRSQKAKKAGDRLDELLLVLKTDAAQGMEMIMHQFMGYVYTICAGHLKNCCSHTEIEECAAEVFAEVYQNRERVDEQKGSLKAFICTLAKRHAVDTYNRKLKQQNHVDIEGLDLQDPADTETAVANAETTGFLIACIRALGEPDSEIFIRKFYFCQSTKEIARAVGLKENAVDKRVSRGYAKLRDSLKGVL